MTSSWPEIIRWSTPPWLVPHVLLYIRTSAVLIKSAPADLFVSNSHPPVPNALQERLRAIPSHFPRNPMFNVRTCAEGLTRFNESTTGYLSTVAWEHTRLGKWFREGLQENCKDISEDFTRIKAIACPMLFLILNSTEDPRVELLEPECRQFRGISDSLAKKVAVMVKMFAMDLQTQLRSATSESALLHLSAFCLTILDQYTNAMSMRAQMMIHQFAPASFMGVRDRARLALLMLHPRQQEMIQLFPPKICPIRGARATKGWLDGAHIKPIPFEHWRELSRYLPGPADVVADFPATRFVQEFKCQVWEPNGDVALPHMTPAEKSLFMRETPVDWYTQSGLIMQMFTLWLPNWAELWVRMGWPRSRTVQLRIKLMRNRGWIPDARQMLSVFFPTLTPVLTE